MAEAIYDYQFRLIVIGDSDTGKSSLIRFFADRKSVSKTTKYRPTIGADYFVRVIPAAPKCETRLRLQIWDTAGQERYRAITKSYYRDSIGVVLVFDLTNRKSFDHIHDWYEESRVHILPHKAAYVLVGNKSDLPAREVTKKEAETYARHNGMPYMETSCVSGHLVDDCFTHLGQSIFSKLKSGEIRADSGWEAVKDHYTADKRIKLGASNRDHPELGGTRCG